MYSEKYKHFSMRLHYELPDYMAQNSAAELAGGWTVKLGEGVLTTFYVSEVDNPAPSIKSDSVDIPGTNGKVYMDEAAGRVYFDDKTVKVVLVGQGEMANWHLFDTLRSDYQGRIVDFTFDDHRDVKWFQTGRVSVEFDEKLCTFTLIFEEVKPFRYSTDLFQKAIYLSTNYERHNNADNWYFNTDTYGTPPYSSDTHTNTPFQTFVYSFNSVTGVKYKRTKRVGSSYGKLLFGINSVVGGDVWFEDVYGNKSKTFATVCPPSFEDDGVHNGEFRMCFTVDGSYYEWQTVSGVRKYLPTIRCTYAMSQYVPTDTPLSNAEIINSGNTIVTHSFPSNVEIRPTASGSDGIIIADGVAVEVDLNGYEKTVPRIVLPGVNATKDGLMSKSVFCWTRNDAGDIAVTDNCGFRFIPVEVF